jgi:hypothetical protein
MNLLPDDLLDGLNGEADHLKVTALLKRCHVDDRGIHDDHL